MDSSIHAVSRKETELSAEGVAAGAVTAGGIIRRGATGSVKPTPSPTSLDVFVRF